MKVFKLTPLVELKKSEEKFGSDVGLFAKLESFNSAGSVKDRVALQMVVDAENSKNLKPTSVIIEPTSGNTGIGLAAVAAEKGYDCIIVMPDNMSEQRQKLIKSYGAKLILTPAKDGMKGSIDKAKELAQKLENA